MRGSHPVLGGAEGEIPSAYSAPKNQGVFQLLKEVTFRIILVFCNSQKWSYFGGICVRPDAILIGLWDLNLSSLRGLSAWA